MKRTILLTNASPMYAGGEFYVLLLAGELMARGHDVAVSCRSDNLLLAKCRERRIPTEPVEFPLRGGLRRCVGALRGIIGRRGVNIVHTNTNYDRTAGAIAARLSGALHVASIHSFHSIQYNLTHWLRNRYWTDRFITLGGGAKDILVKEDGIPPGKISTVPLGLDPDETFRSEELRMKVRREFGISGDELLLGNVGRLVPFKGQEYLLRSFADASKTRPGARLMIVGEGELDSSLRRLASDLGIAGRTIFTGFRDDIPGLYSAMDVYVHSSVEGGGETFPFAVLQALAFGLPMVVTEVGEVGAMVENGVNGFAVRDRDPGVFAGALAKLLDDPHLRASMGREGRNLLMKKFTVAAMADGVESVYRSLRQTPPAGPGRSAAGRQPPGRSRGHSGAIPAG
ncbi:MAG TPA: glycosyltransferase family 4 protein [Bacteroidota bacterium]|nr:glycosyltransferase family 4 protein [Bacteroidota bacterium]